MLKKFKLGEFTFVVQDEYPTSSWGFWDFYAGGQWETTTLAAADKILKKDDLLLDIGAWVGPLTLWEAARGVKVIAIEPDPVAFDLLEQNVIINGFKDKVTLINEAVTDGSEPYVDLYYRNQGGNAWSSIVGREDLTEKLEVPTTTIQEIISTFGKPKLVKIDIEGSESILLPHSGPLLRKMKIPILLATHDHWYPKGSEQFMEEELSHWNLKDLYNSMYLGTPK